MRPLNGALLGVNIVRVTKPLPGITVTLALDNGLAYQFWVGVLDSRLTLAATIEASLSHVERSIDLSAQQLWYPGWDLSFKETPVAAGGRTLVMARCAGVPVPTVHDPDVLDPDVLFPALDLMLIAQQSLRSHQATRLPQKLH